MRDRITFKCSECGEENYIGTRNKRKNPERYIRRKNKKGRLRSFLFGD